MTSSSSAAGHSLSDTSERDACFVMQTYARQPVLFVRGEGAHLWDDQGNSYLDFLAGISVCSVGHCHPRVADAIAQQARTLMHVSNLFQNPLQARLAERLCRLTGMERAFFGESGAEANECAIKIARKWAKQHRGADCHEIITFSGSFHGRTLATVTATAQPKYQAPFAPLPPGFIYAPLGNLEALRAAVTERTCAVMIEPVQGESGIHIVAPETLRAIRALCDEHGLLLICDEVQCGMGRTGRFLASQWAGVRPDIVTLAKAVASGVPMGVCLARGEAAVTLQPGDHGSTFGGQPLACAAAHATLDVLEGEGLMERARQVGRYLLEALHALRREFPEAVGDARGIGLMAALDFTQPIARGVLRRLLLEQRIVANAVSDFTLRFLPPLVIAEADCEALVNGLRSILKELCE